MNYRKDVQRLHCLFLKSWLEDEHVPMLEIFRSFHMIKKKSALDCFKYVKNKLYELKVEVDEDVVDIIKEPGNLKLISREAILKILEYVARKK